MPPSERIYIIRSFQPDLSRGPESSSPSGMTPTSPGQQIGGAAASPLADVMKQWRRQKLREGGGGLRGLYTGHAHHIFAKLEGGLLSAGGSLLTGGTLAKSTERFTPRRGRGLAATPPPVSKRQEKRHAVALPPDTPPDVQTSSRLCFKLFMALIHF